MNFNKHFELEGRHAFLSPSSYHWTNYDEDKLIERYLNHQAKIRGTELHEFACSAIKLGITLPDVKKTINMYVNDAIGFSMTPEQPLYYSPNCFGTADAISFRKGLLRIHDLKTGVSPTSMTQLEIYMALFCLEYDINPNDIRSELRIYQLDDVEIHSPLPEDILYISDKIVTFDRRIEELRAEAL